MPSPLPEVLDLVLPKLLQIYLQRLRNPQPFLAGEISYGVYKESTVQCPQPGGVMIEIKSLTKSEPYFFKPDRRQFRRGHRPKGLSDEEHLQPKLNARDPAPCVGLENE